MTTRKAEPRRDKGNVVAAFERDAHLFCCQSDGGPVMATIWSATVTLGYGVGIVIWRLVTSSPAS